MKNLQILFIMFALTRLAPAQTDSTKKLKIHGVSLEMYGVGSRGNYRNSQADFQKYINNNELLNKDLSGYMHGYGGYNTNFNAALSGRIFFEPLRQKKIRKEYFIGLRGGSDVLTGTVYSQSYSDTVGKYVNTANNTYLLEINNYYNSYNYQVISQRLILPFGINFTTNKLRRFWFTAGLELSPGITFNNRFDAYFTSTVSKDLYDPFAPAANSNNYAYRNYTGGTTTYRSTKLKGTGFIGFATVPLSINLRASKKIDFFKHLNLNASLAPGLYYAQNKFTKTQSSFVLNSSLGFRYNW